MDLRVATRNDLASVAEISAEWQELHDRAGQTNPFTAPEWPLTWLAHFATPTGSTPYVVEVRDGGKLVGVAPLVQCPVGRRAARILSPIGTGQPWIGPYELPAMLAEPRLGRSVARAVVEQLCEQPGDWDWVNLILGSAAPWFEPEWLTDTSFTVLVRRVLAEVVLDLSGESDLYVGRRNLKESLRRARNRLNRDFGADGWLVRRQCGTRTTAAFGRLADLHGRRAGFPGRPRHANVVEDSAVRAYLRAVVEQLAQRNAVSIYELLVGDEVVASLLVLHTTAGSYSSISGLADEAWPYSAVTYLQSHAIADARAAGHRQMSMSVGPNQTKLRWTDQVVATPEFGIVGPRRRSRVGYLAASAWSAVGTYGESRRAHQ